MPPTNDMTLNFYYKKSVPEEEEEETPDIPTNKPESTEEYVPIPNTFSSKDGGLIVIGGLLIASGSFVIIKRLYI